ncbi:hypothetical protein FACS1894184_11660 [Clostridia bacterium]|nr:hypothetical protein FACS1894184_11660 [Clostridia bacterium]
MEKSGFFNSITHDRVYTAEDFAAYYGDLFTNGVFYSEHTALQVVPDSGMNVSLLAGSAWINGYRYFNTGAVSITLDVPDGTYTRIDRIVVRWDLAARSVYYAVLKGVMSTAPVPPVLTRDAGLFELCLADVYVRGGVGAIESGDIVDTRLNPTLCGSSRTKSFLMYGEPDTEDLMSLMERFMERFSDRLSVVEANTNVFTLTIPNVKFNYVDYCSFYVGNNNEQKYLFLSTFQVTVTNPLFKPNSIIFAKMHYNDQYALFTNGQGNGTCIIGGTDVRSIRASSSDILPAPTTRSVTLDIAVFNL